MKLREWRQTQKLSLHRMASLLGLANQVTYRRYEIGEHRADAPIIEKIVAATDGVVTPQDMHETRLSWLRENKPDETNDLPRQEFLA